MQNNNIDLIFYGDESGFWRKNKNLQIFDIKIYTKIYGSTKGEASEDLNVDVVTGVLFEMLAVNGL
jgi:hypothetical protein